MGKRRYTCMKLIEEGIDDMLPNGKVIEKSKNILG